jgi:hypothetical protein
MTKTRLGTACGLILSAFLADACSTTAGEGAKIMPARAQVPLRALLVIGGCCHEYETQKGILKHGLEERLNVRVDIAYSSDTGTAPHFSIYDNPDYAEDYDVVIHDECAADVADREVIDNVLAPHRSRHIPAVVLHCAVHSFRIGDPAEPASPGGERSAWFDLLGLQSSAHGPQLPIAIQFIDLASPITRGVLAWTTTGEELYNTVQLFGTSKPLAYGKQVLVQPNGTLSTEDSVVAWTNDYHGVRIFGTSLGHSSVTVADPRYLDLVSRGLLWACNKLDDYGRPVKGYGR